MNKIILFLFILSLNKTFSKSNIAEETGYILAQQVAFTGLSILANKKNYYGHIIVGGIDLFFSYAGIQNGLYKDLQIQKTAYLLLSSGFVMKAAYTMHFGKNHTDNIRFWTNFIAYNVLVYSGYYLDTLSETPTN